MSKTARVTTAIGIATLVVAVLVGGYLLGWWLKEDAVNRTGEIRRDQFEVQETARDEVIRQAEQIKRIDVDLADPSLSLQQTSALEGQKKAAVVQLCNVASDITGSLTPSVESVILTYC